jgi:D-alanyl-D-alanine carboxypeptidase/D-alanyl-D-alanine-endopeptidase (penicillin-binding protein 4)
MKNMLLCAMLAVSTPVWADTAKELSKLGLSPQNSAVWIAEIGSDQPRFSHRSDALLNPASVMKLVTTAAALDHLGGDFTWKTRIYATGPIQNGVLQGDLIIRGAGDPKLVVERLEPMMKAVRDRGVNNITGDIVLDRSAFAVPDVDPGEFDGEPMRPYNTRPDALLINFKALVMYFTPQPDQGVAQVRLEPPMAGLEIPTSVPLVRGACGDWRARLGADFSNPSRVSFAGGIPSGCSGELVWPVAYVDPATHAQRAVAAMWLQVGGQISGQVRSGSPAAGTYARAPLVVHESLALGAVVKDVNKFSNNVMAQHVFLLMGQFAGRTPRSEPAAVTTLARARVSVRTWWANFVGKTSQAPEPVLDNGSGLSRSERLSARALADLLQKMHGHEESKAFIASMPIAGVDGTLSGMRASPAAGLATLKTGTLRNATALAGYVNPPGGKPLVFVTLYNGPSPAAARLGMERLVERFAAGK